MPRKTWFTIQNFAPPETGGTPTATVNIHDEIGYWGVTAKEFIDEFRAIPSDAQITLSVHSPGGAVFDALAIYNTIRAHATRVTAVVEGLAASAASLIVMAAGKIIMPENSYMMIHNPSSGAWGEVQDLRDAADLLERIESTLVGIYVQRTGAEEAIVRQLLAAETWMDGSEAVTAGFADELAPAVQVAASARPEVLQQFARLPQALRSLPQEATQPDSQPAAAAMAAADVIAACAQAGQMPLAEALVRNGSTAEQVHAELQRAHAITEYGAAAQAPELAQQLITANASADVARLCMEAVRAAQYVPVQGGKPASAGQQQAQAVAIDHTQIYARRRPAANVR